MENKYPSRTSYFLKQPKKLPLLEFSTPNLSLFSSQVFCFCIDSHQLGQQGRLRGKSFGLQTYGIETTSDGPTRRTCKYYSHPFAHFFRLERVGINGMEEWMRWRIGGRKEDLIFEYWKCGGKFHLICFTTNIV
jgi:hypothetical protein